MVTVSTDTRTQDGDRTGDRPVRTAWRSASLAWSSLLDAVGSFDEDESELSGVQIWPRRISFSQHCFFTIYIDMLRNGIQHTGQVPYLQHPPRLFDALDLDSLQEEPGFGR